MIDQAGLPDWLQNLLGGGNRQSPYDSALPIPQAPAYQPLLNTISAMPEASAYQPPDLIEQQQQSMLRRVMQGEDPATIPPPTGIEPMPEAPPQAPSAPDQGQPAPSYRPAYQPPAQPGTGRPTVERWSPLIAEASARYGVPESVIKGIMEIESGGDPGATSSQGAYGLMQTLGLHYAPGEDPYDPRTNIMKGASILADRYARYGDWDHAAAAYFGAVDGNGQITEATDATGTSGSGYVAKFRQAQATYADGAPQAAPQSDGDRSIVAMPEGSSNGSSNRPSQFDPQLSTAEAYAACGPAAAIAFAQLHGRNPSMREATDLAQQRGEWDQATGMHGPEAEVRLIKSLGGEAHLEQGLDEGKLQSELQAGRPVILDTPGHYLVVDQYDPQSGQYHFGTSTTDLRGGRAWMTMEEAQSFAVTGRVRAAIYADGGSTTPESAQSAQSDQSAQAPDRPTYTTMPQNEPVAALPAPQSGSVDETMQRLSQAIQPEPPKPEDATHDDYFKQKSDELAEYNRRQAQSQLAAPTETPPDSLNLAAQSDQKPAVPDERNPFAWLRGSPVGQISAYTTLNPMAGPVEYLQDQLAPFLPEWMRPGPSNTGRLVGAMEGGGPAPTTLDQMAGPSQEQLAAATTQLAGIAASDERALGKPIWQMTPDEYRAARAKNPNLEPFPGEADDPTKTALQVHAVAVTQALAEGKAVPQNVLDAVDGADRAAARARQAAIDFAAGEQLPSWGNAGTVEVLAHALDSAFIQQAQSLVSAAGANADVYAPHGEVQATLDQARDFFRGALANNPQWAAPKDFDPKNPSAYLDARTYAQIAGNIIPSVLAGAAAFAGIMALLPAEIPILGGIAATAAAARLASMATTFPTTFGQDYQDALDFGKTPREAYLAAGISAALQTGVEMIGGGAMASRVVPNRLGHIFSEETMALFKTGAFKERLFGLAGTLAVKAAEEGFEEGSQQFIDNAVMKAFGSDRGLWDQVIDNTIVGAVGGVGFGAHEAAGMLVGDREGRRTRLHDERMDAVRRGLGEEPIAGTEAERHSMIALPTMAEGGPTREIEPGVQIISANLAISGDEANARIADGRNKYKTLIAAPLQATEAADRQALSDDQGQPSFALFAQTTPNGRAARDSQDAINTVAKDAGYLAPLAAAERTAYRGLANLVSQSRTEGPLPPSDLEGYAIGAVNLVGATARPPTSQSNGVWGVTINPHEIHDQTLRAASYSGVDRYGNQVAPVRILDDRGRPTKEFLDERTDQALAAFAHELTHVEGLQHGGAQEEAAIDARTHAILGMFRGETATQEALALRAQLRAGVEAAYTRTDASGQTGFAQIQSDYERYRQEATRRARSPRAPPTSSEPTPINAAAAASPSGNVQGNDLGLAGGSNGGLGSGVSEVVHAGVSPGEQSVRGRDVRTPAGDAVPGRAAAGPADEGLTAPGAGPGVGAAPGPAASPDIRAGAQPGVVAPTAQSANGGLGPLDSHLTAPARGAGSALVANRSSALASHLAILADDTATQADHTKALATIGRVLQDAKTTPASQRINLQAAVEDAGKIMAEGEPGISARSVSAGIADTLVKSGLLEAHRPAEATTAPPAPAPRAEPVPTSGAAPAPAITPQPTTPAATEPAAPTAPPRSVSQPGSPRPTATAETATPERTASASKAVREALVNLPSKTPEDVQAAVTRLNRMRGTLGIADIRQVINTKSDRAPFKAFVRAVLAHENLVGAGEALRPGTTTAQEISLARTVQGFGSFVLPEDTEPEVAQTVYDTLEQAAETARASDPNGAPLNREALNTLAGISGAKTPAEVEAWVRDHYRPMMARWEQANTAQGATDVAMAKAVMNAYVEQLTKNLQQAQARLKIVLEGGEVLNENGSRMTKAEASVAAANALQSLGTSIHGLNLALRRQATYAGRMLRSFQTTSVMQAGYQIYSRMTDLVTATKRVDSTIDEIGRMLDRRVEVGEDSDQIRQIRDFIRQVQRSIGEGGFAGPNGDGDTFVAQLSGRNSGHATLYGPDGQVLRAGTIQDPEQRREYTARRSAMDNARRAAEAGKPETVPEAHQDHAEDWKRSYQAKKAKLALDAATAVADAMANGTAPITTANLDAAYGDDVVRQSMALFRSRDAAEMRAELADQAEQTRVRSLAEMIGKLNWLHTQSEGNPTEQADIQARRATLIQQAMADARELLEDKQAEQAANGGPAQLTESERQIALWTALGAIDAKTATRLGTDLARAGTDVSDLASTLSDLRSGDRVELARERAELQHWISKAQEFAGDATFRSDIDRAVWEAADRISRHALGGGEKAFEQIWSDYLTKMDGQAAGMIHRLLATITQGRLHMLGHYPSRMEIVHAEHVANAAHLDLQHLWDKIAAGEDYATEGAAVDRHLAALRALEASGNEMAGLVAQELGSLTRLKILQARAKSAIAEAVENGADGVLQQAAQDAIDRVSIFVDNGIHSNPFQASHAAAGWSLQRQFEKAQERFADRVLGQIEREVASQQRSQEAAGWKGALRNFREDITPYLLHAMRNPEDPAAREEFNAQVTDWLAFYHGETGKAPLAFRDAVFKAISDYQAYTANLLADWDMRTTDLMVAGGGEIDPSDQKALAQGLVNRLTAFVEAARGGNTQDASRMIAELHERMRGLGEIGEQRSNELKAGLLRRGFSALGIQRAADTMTQFHEFMTAIDPRDPTSIGRFLNYLNNPGLVSHYREFGIINMLSSPTTWSLTGINVISQTINAVMLAFKFPAALGFDMFTSAVSGRERALSGRELLAGPAGIFSREAWAGLQEAWDIMRFGNSRAETDRALAAGDVSHIRIEGLSHIGEESDLPHYQVIRALFVVGHLLSTRPLRAGDAIIGNILYAANLHSLAEREAMRLGHGETAQHILENLIDHPRIVTQAGFLREYTLLQEPSSAVNHVMQALRRLTNEGSPNQTRLQAVGSATIHTMIPFVLIPYNFAKQGLEHSWLGAVWNTGRLATERAAGRGTLPGAFQRELDAVNASRRADGIPTMLTAADLIRADPDAIGVRGRLSDERVRQADQFAKIVLGSTLTALAYWLIGMGRLTGDDPPDQKSREERRTRGIQSRSIKVGNTWYSYDSTPFAIPFSIIATSHEAYVRSLQNAVRTKGASVEEAANLAWGQALVSGATGALGQSPFVRNLDLVQGFLSGSDATEMQAGTNFATNLATRNIPVSGLLNYLATIGDRFERDTSSQSATHQIMSRVIARLPGESKRQSLPTAQGVFGEDIQNQRYAPASNPLQWAQRILTPAWRTSNQKGQIALDILNRYDIHLGKPPDVLSLGPGASIRLETDEEKRQYAQILGPILAKRVVDRYNNPNFQKTTPNANEPLATSLYASQKRALEMEQQAAEQAAVLKLQQDKGKAELERRFWEERGRRATDFHPQ